MRIVEEEEAAASRSKRSWRHFFFSFLH
jgi:hypothetical protein